MIPNTRMPAMSSVVMTGRRMKRSVLIRPSWSLASASWLPRARPARCRPAGPRGARPWRPRGRPESAAAARPSPLAPRPRGPGSPPGHGRWAARVPPGAPPPCCPPSPRTRTALLPGLHRLRRHHHRAGLTRQGEGHVHELAGPERVIAVLERGLELDGAGARVDRVVHEAQPAARHRAPGALRLRLDQQVSHVAIALDLGQ